MDNSPLVIFKPAPAKVVLIPRQSTPIVIEPTRTTSIVIKRSDIPGAPGPEGPPGPPGPPGSIEAAVIDGGNF